MKFDYSKWNGYAMKSYGVKVKEVSNNCYMILISELTDTTWQLIK